MRSPENKNLPNNAEKRPIINEVIFETIRDKNGTIIKYKSSSPDRKAIEIDSSIDITPGKQYRVEILKDTKPEDPSKGFLKGRIVLDDEPAEDASKQFREPSEGEWVVADDNLRKVERLDRQSNRASREMRKETGTTREERRQMNEKEIIAKAKRKRVAEYGSLEEQAYEIEAEQLLDGPDSLGTNLIGFRKNNLIAALRKQKELNLKKQELISEESQILYSLEGEPVGIELRALEEIRRKIKEVDKQEQDLIISNPEAYYGLNLKKLKDYRKNLQDGTIVETDYVKNHIEDILAHFNAGRPVMIYGHLGTGKTELAMHIARKYIGKTALVVSGSKHISPAELYGHQILKYDRADQSQEEERIKAFHDSVDKDFQEWSAKNPNAAEPEMEQRRSQITSARIAQLESQFKGGTVSDFFLGPIYRAMEEGRPVIIDEVNAIPHEVLISLNYILTRKPGDIINVQQDSGRQIVVKEGFGIIMTGNLNQGQEKYVAREDMDPAFLSRIHKIEYDYLPQSKEGALTAEAGNNNELFHLILARVMDRNGNIEGPNPQKLWRLAQAARLTQDVFSGKEVSNAYYFKQGADPARKYVLKEFVLSLRAVDGIITQWQRDGYKYELDYYIWKEFISQSTNLYDRAYLYQVFKTQFGFFSGSGWEQNPNYGVGGVVNSFDLKAPQNLSGSINFFGPRDTVDYAFGKGPKRKEWPKVEIPLDVLANQEAIPEPEEDQNSGPDAGPDNPEVIQLMEASEKIGRDFFGAEYESLFPENLPNPNFSEKVWEKIKSKELMAYYLPEIVLPNIDGNTDIDAYIQSVEQKYPNWLLPQKWVFEQTKKYVETGNEGILPVSMSIKGGWRFIESLGKPNYQTQGSTHTQRYPVTDLARAVADLMAKDGINLADKIKDGDRFQITWSELTGIEVDNLGKNTSARSGKNVADYASKVLNQKVKLPTLLEWSLIANLEVYKKVNRKPQPLEGWGSTSTYEWLEDERYFSGGEVVRLLAGDSDSGGLRHVDSGRPSDGFGDVGFRLIGGGSS